MVEPSGEDPTLTWRGERDEEGRVWAGISDEGGQVARLGERLADRFELRQAVGAGGMGVVYRAFDLELEETVAVKLLHTDVHSHGGALGALRREVRAARAVVSPHVVRVFELHHSEAATFLVMEFIEGSSLAALLASRGRLSQRDALRVLDHVARGLAATHERGLVHRDVKPGNVLIRSDNTAVLADFGLSRGPTTGLTGRFIPAGTPAYMAPEQVLGGALTAAADVFAFGVLAYELLAGVLPWNALTPMEFALAKARTPAAPLTTRTPEVTQSLWEVVRGCIALDPKDRLHDGATVLAALQGAIGTPRSDASRRKSAQEVEASLPLVWIRPIEVDDDALREEADDLREELQGELGTRRSIRVVDGASLARLVRDGGCARSAAEAQGITWIVRCRLKRRQGAIRARLQVTRVKTDELVYSVELKFADLAQPEVARTIGDHLARALSASERGERFVDELADSGAASASAAIMVGRRHLRTFDPALVDVAAALFGHALACSPHDPSLLALRACALARSWALRGAIQAAQATELRALMNQLEGIDSDDGEIRLAHAVALLTTGDAVGAARRAREAIARQPSLASAQAMLARLLAEADLLEDSARRLDVAARLDPELPEVDLTRAIVAALQSRDVDAMHALAALGDRAEARHARVIWTFRFALWRQDHAAIQRLLDDGLDAAGLHDDSPVRRALTKASAIALRRASPESIVVDLVRRAPIDAQQWLELETEVLASVGAADAAARSLAAALGYGSVGLAWWSRCPVLGVLRESPVGAAIQARLEHRSRRIYAAIRDARDLS